MWWYGATLVLGLVAGAIGGAKMGYRIGLDQIDLIVKSTVRPFFRASMKRVKEKMPINHEEMVRTKVVIDALWEEERAIGTLSISFPEEKDDPTT